MLRTKKEKSKTRIEGSPTHHPAVTPGDAEKAEDQRRADLVFEKRRKNRRTRGGVGEGVRKPTFISRQSLDARGERVREREREKNEKNEAAKVRMQRQPNPRLLVSILKA